MFKTANIVSVDSTTKNSGAPQRVCYLDKVEATSPHDFRPHTARAIRITRLNDKGAEALRDGSIASVSRD